MQILCAQNNSAQNKIRSASFVKGSQVKLQYLIKVVKVVVKNKVSNNDTEACLSDNVCFALYTAGNALMRAYRPLLDQYELTYPQYLVMQALWLQDRASMTQLSRATRLDMGTLTPIVKRLESKLFLQRLADETDERKKVIALTKAGFALQADALAQKSTLLEKVSMTEHDIESLRTLCLTLTAELNQK
ncbi:MarR family transcriptional regulator [Shewanella sp. GutCb]|nr:MarR family transcriptional regulator [Shewanella sp. GutCb]